MHAQILMLILAGCPTSEEPVVAPSGAPVPVAQTTPVAPVPPTGEEAPQQNVLLRYERAAPEGTCRGAGGGGNVAARET